MELKPFSLITLKTVSPFRGAPNDKLRWEKTASYNIGVDFSVLKSAINLSVDYYYRKGTDLIGVKNLPLENGFQRNDYQLG